MGIRQKWKGFRPLPPDVESRLCRLPPLLKESGVDLCYLFGSRAGSAAGNDVDLAFAGSAVDRGRLRSAISDLLQTDRVDLVDLGTASPGLRFEVIRTGRVLWKESDEVENRFEMQVLRSFQDREPVRRRQAEILAERAEAWLSSRHGSREPPEGV